ncbi:MAG: hypothetical protein JWR35_3652 [Marmoricola sp.]|nr:hypothetical protein [Marmoricola sp.]
MRLEQDLDRLGQESLEELMERTPYRVQPIARAPRRRLSLRGPLLVLLAIVLAGFFIVRPFSYHAVATAPVHPQMYSDGTYVFMKMQPNNPVLPVGYNPCLKLPVVINFAGATPDIRDTLAQALREVNAATGMHLEYVGTSQLHRRDVRNTGSILVSFDSVASDDVLDGAAAVGGSSSYDAAVAGSTQYYVGGAVTLNRDAFNGYPRDLQVAILMHELGHALGLAHAPGEHELMSAHGSGSYHFQHGDLTGLAKLGQLPCQ